jgi:hypothetical protein
MRLSLSLGVRGNTVRPRGLVARPRDSGTYAFEFINGRLNRRCQRNLTPSPITLVRRPQPGDQRQEEGMEKVRASRVDRRRED